jgi:hypothetical protein
MSLFAIGAPLWQRLDQFEKRLVINIEEAKEFDFF